MRMKIHLGHGWVWLAGMGLASSALAAHVKSHGYATTQAVASVRAASGAVSGAHQAKPFSVNAASEPQWEALKGIGPKRAQAIVAYRKAHGPFKQPADVAQVKGVSASALLRIAKVNHVRFEVHPA